MPTQTSHHFDNFVGHYVRIIKSDGFARYGILSEIKRDYAYLRYPDGKQEAIACKLISTIADAPGPRYSLEDESQERVGYEERHHRSFQQRGQPVATKDLFILYGFILTLGGAATLFYTTTLLALAETLGMVIITSGLASLGLALAAVGLYLIIRT